MSTLFVNINFYNKQVLFLASTGKEPKPRMSAASELSNTTLVVPWNRGPVATGCLPLQIRPKVCEWGVSAGHAGHQVWVLQILEGQRSHHHAPHAQLSLVLCRETSRSGALPLAMISKVRVTLQTEIKQNQVTVTLYAFFNISLRNICMVKVTMWKYAKYISYLYFITISQCDQCQRKSKINAINSAYFKISNDILNKFIFNPASGKSPDIPIRCIMLNIQLSYYKSSLKESQNRVTVIIGKVRKWKPTCSDNFFDGYFGSWWGFL